MANTVCSGLPVGILKVNTILTGIVQKANTKGLLGDKHKLFHIRTMGQFGLRYMHIHSRQSYAHTSIILKLSLDQFYPDNIFLTSPGKHIVGTH